MLKANNQLKPSYSVTFSTLPPVLNLKNVPGLAKHFRRNLANLFTVPFLPHLQGRLTQEPLATHRNHVAWDEASMHRHRTSCFGRDLHLQKQGLFHSRLGKANTQRMGFRPKKRSKVASLDMTWLSKFRTFPEMRPNSTIRLRASPPTMVGAGTASL